jgi:phosphoglycolate phosphatase
MPTLDQSAVLFDLDGVLVDSRAPITGSINDALIAHGLPPRPAESLVKFIGPPLVGAFAELTGEAPDSALVVSCVSAYRTRYADVSLRETTVVPGMIRVLDELVKRHRLAVATSKPLRFAEPLLDALGLRSFFELCAGPELDASAEEKAVTIAGALERLDCPRALMVGDRALDIVGAHRCSIPAVAVTWGAGSVEELRGARPDAIVDAPDELPGAIAAMMATATT